jgi:hypothetical protein
MIQLPLKSDELEVMNMDENTPIVLDAIEQPIGMDYHN